MTVKLNEPLGKTAYVNARLLDPASETDAIGGVLTEGERIAAFGPKVAAGAVPSDARVVDCGGLCLAPGLVDIRVHLCEPGQEHKETLETTGRSAVTGGVTSLVGLPDTTPVIDDMSVLEFVARRARMVGLAKVYAYGAVTKGMKGEELAEMGLLAQSGAVAFSDANHTITDTRMMRLALSYANTFDLVIVQHAEEPGLAGSGVMNAGALATRMGLGGIPREAEIIMVERDIRIAEMTGGRLHFAHVSTAPTIEAIRQAKRRGVRITCDTAPPYFALNEAEAANYRTFARLSPPLRTEEDRVAVAEGIRCGVIDAIASDHSPQDEESKRVPFALAAPGGVGLETLLPVSLGLVRDGTLEILDLLRLLTDTPARLMGLDAGRLRIDAPADLVVFDPDCEWTVTAETLVGKSKNSPFDEKTVHGRVERTVVDGRTVFKRDA